MIFKSGITYWALLGSIQAYFRPIRAERLAFGQTSQLRLEIRLIFSNYQYKLCNTSIGSWNHIFHMFVPYSALTRASLVQSGLKI